MEVISNSPNATFNLGTVIALSLFERGAKEDNSMNAMTKQAEFTRYLNLEEKGATADSVRMAQSAFLSELPGVALAVLTLAYIVTSFISLI